MTSMTAKGPVRVLAVSAEDDHRVLHFKTVLQYTPQG